MIKKRVYDSATSGRYNSTPTTYETDRQTANYTDPRRLVKPDERIPVYLGRNGELYDSSADARKYGAKPAKRKAGENIPLEVDEKGGIKYPSFVGKNGQVYPSLKEAKRLGKNLSSKNPKGRIALDVDEQGNIRPLVYIGKNGQLYVSPADAKKYGFNTSGKYDKDRTPVEVNERGNIQLLRVNQSGLEKAAASMATILGIFGGVYFLSANITGNVISDSVAKTASFLGTGLIVLGIIAGFFWIRAKKQ